MQISDLVGQYHQAVASGAETLTGTKGVENLVASLRALTKGNIFEGTVTSVKNGRVTLALSGGQQVMARLDGKIALTEGQSMFFQVKSNDGTQIAIRPFEIDGAGANYTLMQALSAAGLPTESGYLSMVNRMMEEQMPIDRASLQQMARLVNANPQVDVQTLVQLQKLGIPISVENASQFENYKEDHQAITKEIDTLLEKLPQAMQGETSQELSASGLSAEVPKETRQLGNQILEILTEGLEEVPEAGEMFSGAQSLSNPAEAAQDNPQVLKQQESQQVPGTEMPQEQQRPLEEADAQQLSQSGTSAQQETGIQQTDAFSYVPSSVPHTLGAVLEPQQFQTLNHMVGQLLGMEQTNYTKDSGVVEVLKDLQQVLKDPLPLEKEKLGKLFSSKEFRALIKDTAEQQWTLKPQDLKEDRSVQRLYERLNNQMQKIESALKNAGQEHTEFSQMAGEIRNNVAFMDQINQVYTYTQIPLKMSGQHASGELFVYTNKKALAEGNKEVSAFLHLDLDHLGATDVSVRMSGREVTTKFYLDNDAAYALLLKNYPVLEAKLQKKGYHCSIFVVNEEKHVNFVNDFLKMDQPSAGHLHRYSFDMRA